MFILVWFIFSHDSYGEKKIVYVLLIERKQVTTLQSKKCVGYRKKLRTTLYHTYWSRENRYI